MDGLRKQERKMNDSKKLLYIKIAGIIIILLFISFFLFLIIKIDIIGHLFSNKNYIMTSTNSNLEKYLEDLHNREYKVKVIDKKIIENTNKEKEIIEEDKSIFKYINKIKSKKSNISLISKNIDNKDKDENLKNQREKDEIAKTYRKKIQNIYNNEYYDKSSWVLIDEDNDLYGYKFYFDDRGKLIYDTVSSDYRVIDSYGREVDEDLEPILYKVKIDDNIKTLSKIEEQDKGLIASNVIITEKVALKIRRVSMIIE